MTNGYRYGYLIAGYGRARWRRITLADRIRMRKARKRRAADYRRLL